MNSQHDKIAQQDREDIAQKKVNKKKCKELKKQNNDILTAELHLYVTTNHNLSNECVRIIDYIVWGLIQRKIKISKDRYERDKDEIYSFVIELLLQKLKYFKKDRATGHTFVHMIVDQSLMRYLRERIYRYNNMKHAEHIYSCKKYGEDNCIFMEEEFNNYNEEDNKEDYEG